MIHRELNHLVSQRAYSLIEAMITVALLTIIIAISAPSFAVLIKKNELTTLSNTIIGSLYFARSHAIAHQKNVHICQLSLNLSTTCARDYNYNRDWSNGWLIFTDTNRDNEFDENDDLLRKVTLNTSTSIIFNQRGRLRFFPDGSARSAGYYLCSSNLDEVRHVYLLHTGRARVNQSLTRKQLQICARRFES